MVNKLRQLKVILYRLKRDYGVIVTITQKDTPTVDYSTGTVTDDVTTYSNVKAIMTPIAVLMQVIKDNVSLGISTTFANNMVNVILDHDTYVPKLDDIITTSDNTEYVVKEIQKLPSNYGYILSVSNI